MAEFIPGSGVAEATGDSVIVTLTTGGSTLGRLQEVKGNNTIGDMTSQPFSPAIGVALATVASGSVQVQLAGVVQQRNGALSISSNTRLAPANSNGTVAVAGFDSTVVGIALEADAGDGLFSMLLTLTPAPVDPA